MWNCFWAAAAALLLLLVAAAPARAQTAKPDAATEAAAAASAAMERAKRQAAGPMRVILEASRPRRKTTDAEASATTPAAAQADSGSVRAVANRSPSVAAAVPEAITRSVAVAPAPAPTSAPTPVVPQPVQTAAPPPAVAAPVVAEPSGVVTQFTLTSEALQGKAAAARVPGLEVSGATTTTPVSAVANLASLPAVPNRSLDPARIKLLSRVDPELPQRQLDDLGRNAVVTVDLTIRADGSVGNVAMVPPTPRGIQRAVVAALEQWRFEPLLSDRVHRVQLIFNSEQ